MALQLLDGPWFLLQFCNHFYIDGTSWTSDQPATRPMPIHRKTQTQNKHTQTFMPRVGFEPTISMFERARTVHALDCEATMICMVLEYRFEIMINELKLYYKDIRMQYRNTHGRI
jgi:hypothetical protein